MLSALDGVAFQTHILSLNAAVEAASAGEHGRGFAIVAQKVRCLAQQSAEASKQARRQIEQTQGSIETCAAQLQHMEATRECIQATATATRDRVQVVARIAVEQTQEVHLAQRVLSRWNEPSG